VFQLFAGCRRVGICVRRRTRKLRGDASGLSSVRRQSSFTSLRLSGWRDTNELSVVAAAHVYYIRPLKISQKTVGTSSLKKNLSRAFTLALLTIRSKEEDLL